MALTFSDVMEHLAAGIQLPVNTVDKLEPDAAGTEVQGIVTAFAASQYVVEQAARLGANLVITHEGVFYSHQGHGSALEQDSVYQEKSALISSSGVGIYRFHDTIHRYALDGIVEGLLQELEWEAYVERHLPEVSILSIPEMTVSGVAEYLKQKLNIPYVRVAGNLSATCSRVGVLVGYRGMAIRSSRCMSRSRLIWSSPVKGPNGRCLSISAMRSGRARTGHSSCSAMPRAKRRE